jgi:hypothetical protein
MAKIFIVRITPCLGHLEQVLHIFSYPIEAVEDSVANMIASEPDAENNTW